MNKKKFINNIMTELHKINVKLSEGQKRKLAKAYRDNEEVSIKLAHKNLSGSDTLISLFSLVYYFFALFTNNFSTSKYIQ